jgi:predicted RNA-binding Zn ribbon-like protein
MSFGDYDTNTLRLVLNLASYGEGALSLTELAADPLLTEHGYQGEDLKPLARSIAAVLAEQDETGFLDALAALLAEQPCKPYLTRHDGVPHLHYARDDAPFAEWVATMATAGLVLHVCRDGRDRLRRCAAAGCGRWFCDTSRNSSRRYCSPACASRTTVAAYRARKRDDGAKTGTID